MLITLAELIYISTETPEELVWPRGAIFVMSRARTLDIFLVLPFRKENIPTPNFTDRPPSFPPALFLLATLRLGRTFQYLVEYLLISKQQS